MRNLTLVPSPMSEDVLVDAADWAEISAVFKRDGNVSREDLTRALHRKSGIKEASAQRVAQDAFSELSDRISSCGNSRLELNKYPFKLDANQSLLSVRRPFRLNSNFGLLYWFLLFVTRADMSSKKRVLAGVDPTTVFEQLCADVLRSFWGGDTAFSGSMVVGTSAERVATVSRFKTTIADLCQNLGEGIGWKQGAKPPGGGDGRLDIAAWKKFADNRQGNLFGFAQCKTGVHWREHLTKLQPRTYCNRFMQKQPAIVPLRLYMVPNRIVFHRWEEHTDDGGLLMDRCRLVQYGSNIQSSTLKRCKAWLRAAYDRQKSRRVTS
jgi:hypothetical protein